MARIDLIYPGKTRERFLADGIEDYSKRLARFYTVAHSIVRSPAKQGKLSDKVFMERESALLLQAVQPASYLVMLDRTGRAMRSEELACLLNHLEEQGKKTLSFVVGGYLGLAPGSLARADLVLSLSAMTFTHEMCRLFLVEQLYRAATINAAVPYHL